MAPRPRARQRHSEMAGRVIDKALQILGRLLADERGEWMSTKYSAGAPGKDEDLERRSATSIRCIAFTTRSCTASEGQISAPYPEQHNGHVQPVFRGFLRA